MEKLLQQAACERQQAAEAEKLRRHQALEDRQRAAQLEEQKLQQAAEDKECARNQAAESKEHDHKQAAEEKERDRLHATELGKLRLQNISDKKFREKEIEAQKLEASAGLAKDALLLSERSLFRPRSQRLGTWADKSGSEVMLPEIPYGTPGPSHNIMWPVRRT